MKKQLLTLLSLFISGLSFGQSYVDDNVLIRQVNTGYPNVTVQSFQGLLSGGHPTIEMFNAGGIESALLPTPANTLLGTFIYSGYDGANVVQAGRIGVITKGTFSSGNYPSQMYFNLGGTATCCGTTRMVIDGNSGHVGIGTTNPTHRLEVNGTVRSKEVKVEATNWPDYVFEQGYSLRNLEEVEAFIRQNQHLPDMPSEKEIMENGIELGKMNASLLLKIEELTLYALQHQKEIKLLKVENDLLENQLEKFNSIDQQLLELKGQIEKLESTRQK